MDVVGVECDNCKKYIYINGKYIMLNFVYGFYSAVDRVRR